MEIEHMKREILPFHLTIKNIRVANITMLPPADADAANSLSFKKSFGSLSEIGQCRASCLKTFFLCHWALQCDLKTKLQK